MTVWTNDEAGGVIWSDDEVAGTEVVTDAELAASGGADLVGFIQSGTGAVSETVQDALRRMVFSGQYSSAANFNAARDALTDTAAFRNLQVGISTASSTAGIFFPARTAGRGQQGVISYDVTFSGTVDPNISIGYNLAADGTASEAGEPQAHMAFEGNYNDGSGQNKMEAYFQFSGLSGQTTEVYRPYFIQVNRSTRSITNQHFADIHQFGGADALTAPSALDIYPTHIDFPTGNSATGNYFSIAGATTGNVPILQVAGSDSGINAGYSSKGTGGHIFYTGAGARTVVVINNVNSSVNYLDLYPSTAGSTPTIRVGGSDTDIDLGLSSKGTDSIRFFTNGTSQEQARVLHTASATRYVTLTGSNGGNPTISTSAGSLNVGSALQLSTLGAFAASDKYLIVDSSGNVHVSALGPAS